MVNILQIIILATQWLVARTQCGCKMIDRSTNNILNSISYDASIAGKSEKFNFGPKLESYSMFENMIKVQEGNYMLGNSQLVNGDDSLPAMVHVNDFYIDKFEVSNEQFDEFIKHTGYITTAEKFGNSFIFEGLLTQSQRHDYRNSRIVGAPWWYKVNNTFWRQPEGIESTIATRMHHPVVHVSWIDALKFCNWKNKRLPSEIEWEVACRGGKKDKLFPWGNKLKPKNQFWLVYITVIHPKNVDSTIAMYHL